MDIDAPIFALIDARVGSPEERQFYRQLLASTRYLADEHGARDEYLELIEDLIEDQVANTDILPNLLKMARLWAVLRRKHHQPGRA